MSMTNADRSDVMGMTDLRPAHVRGECQNCGRPIFRDALGWFHWETGVPWCAVELFAPPRMAHSLPDPILREGATS